MSGLFVSFDPFYIGFILLFVIRILILFFPLINFLVREIKILFMKNLKSSLPLRKNIGGTSLVLLIFFLITFFNVLSLWAHIFTPTAHISFTVAISLTVWFCAITANLSYFLKNFVTHLAPSGTPLPLLSFMILIELVRQLIRPITLRVRLRANLTAGHLILGLLAFPDLFFRIFSQFPLFLLEILVAFVQAYVFSLLFLLYFNEYVIFLSPFPYSFS